MLRAITTCASIYETTPILDGSRSIRFSRNSPMPAESQKNLILAMSYGYSYERLYPFLQSLKETGFDGEIVIFVGATSVATMNRLRHAGVELKSFIYPFKRAHEMRKRNPLYRLRPLAQQLIGRLDSSESIARWSFPFHNIQSLRFLLYYWFLRSRPNRYRYIFFTDLRDVTFQRNPFIHAEGRQLRFYVEEPITIRQCPINSRWIREYFGEEILREIGGNLIVCSGTTLGDYDSIIRYLEEFLLTLRQARSIPWRVGFDQGVHNYLAYKKLTGSITFCPNRESEVFTMGFIRATRSYRATNKAS
jgi:hypothetical protein